jgi:hypothetical protein
LRKPSGAREGAADKHVPHAPRHAHTHVWSR